jgi:hypothetical protein
MDNATPGAPKRIALRDPDRPPAKRPYFAEDGGELNFHDPAHGVFAVVEFDPERPCGLSILEFSVSERGKGNGTAALKWLRRRFEHVSVQDIGYEETDGSWLFWRKMAERGLADTLYSDCDPATPVFSDGTYHGHPDDQRGAKP